MRSKSLKFQTLLEIIAKMLASDNAALYDTVIADGANVVECQCCR